MRLVQCLLHNLRANALPLIFRRKKYISKLKKLTFICYPYGTYIGAV